MNNNTNNTPDETKRRSGNGSLIKILLVTLIVLIIVIIILLLKSCSGNEANDPVVLEPDYPAMSIDSGAESIEGDPSGEAPEVSQGGGSVTIAFTDNVTYTLSTGKMSLFYQNPGASTHNVVVQVLLLNGETEYLMAQSGILEPGYQVTSLTVDENAPTLSVGGYDGKLRLRFYDPETGERAIVDTDIPCTITVKD